MSSQPLLNFIDYRILELAVTPIDGYDDASPKRGQSETTFSVNRSPDHPQQFQVVTTWEFHKQPEDANVPYDVKVAMSGEFFCLAPLDTEKLPATVANNALVLLYGVARGVVGQVTADGVHGRFVLPTITFDEVLQLAVSDNTQSGIVADPPEFTARLRGSKAPAEGSASDR